MKNILKKLGERFLGKRSLGAFNSLDCIEPKGCRMCDRLNRKAIIVYDIAPDGFVCLTCRRGNRGEGQIYYDI